MLAAAHRSWGPCRRRQPLGRGQAVAGPEQNRATQAEQRADAECVVEAGLYVTAGTKITMSGGEVVKARTLSGENGLMFIRNSVTGAVEMRRRQRGGIELNAELHAN
jgi:hypothetical protein